MAYSGCLPTRLNPWLRGPVSPRSTLRRLCAAISVGSLMEGKMTSDVLMLTLRENVGFASTMINNYLSALGLLTFISGRCSPGR